MSIDHLTSDESTVKEPNDSWNIQASPHTWFLYALVMNDFSRFFGFNLPDSSYSYSTETSLSTLSAAQQAKVREFFETKIHFLPQEVKKERESIETLKNQWIQDRRLSPLQLSNIEIFRHSSTGIYMVLDHNRTPLFVVKPMDEEIACLNNPRYPNLPGVDFGPRHYIPRYQSVERECACSEIASLLGSLQVPKTEMILAESSDFHDVTDHFHKGHWDRVLYATKMEKKAQEFLEKNGSPDHQKICSKRAYIPHAQTIHDFLNEEWQTDNLKNERESAVDVSEIEMANLLMWIFGNTDGHGGNVLVTPKNGLIYQKPVYGLTLIDLSLTLPEKNEELLNTLPEIFSEVKFLSPEAKSLILNFPTEKAIDILKSYHLDKTVDAFKERLEALKHFAEHDLSLQEIDERLSYLGKSPASALDLTRPVRSSVHHPEAVSSTSFTSNRWLRA